MKLGVCRWDSSVGRGGRLFMSGLRYDRILASTALALVLAAPASAYATPPNDGASKLAAVPTANAKPTPGSETLDSLHRQPHSRVHPIPPAARLFGAGANADVLDIFVTPTAPTVPDVTGTAVPADAAAPSAMPAAAAEQTPPPDPLASLDPADRPVAEQINELLTAKSDKIFRHQEGAQRRRNLLPRPQPAAAVARPRRGELPAPGRSRLPA